ncbi:MAG TPA: ATP-binding protein [candidate division Zixibacteria bacterium]|nr:ATP-binding protein [candidate division Zixibacteria bacterium]
MRNALMGVAVGTGSALVSVSLAEATGADSPYVVLMVLAVASVGLGLGAAAATWSYGSAAIVTLVLTFPTPAEPVTSDFGLRMLILIGGTPLVILLVLRAERQREAAERARQEMARAHEIAERERQAAQEARASLRIAYQQVEQERTRLEEVAEAIPEPLIVYDATGRGRYANRAALRTFGRSFYERGPEEWARLAQPRDERGVPLAEDEWPQLQASRQAFRRRLLVRLPMSGRDLLIDVEGTPVPDGGAVLLLRDVGKEVDERRRLSRFASFVAHELRNPLAVAKARIELAGREQGTPPRAAEHTNRALESVDAAIGILERLELFSRAEAGRLEAVQERFDLRAAVEAAVERVRVRGASRPFEVIGEGRPAAVGDRRLTEQAITNLLSNADRYSTPGEPVEIEIVGGPMPEVLVRDQGPGIPEEIAAVLFRERVSSGRGLGLGLYLVNASMEAQGGSVELLERAPRTVFALRWPSAAAPGAGDQDAAPIAEVEA